MATLPTAASTWVTVCWSAAERLPPERLTTTVSDAWSLFWKGVASFDACMLGVSAGRNPLLVSLATLDSPGKKCTLRTVAAIHRATTG